MDLYTTKPILTILAIAALFITTGCGSRSPKAIPVVTNAHLKHYTLHVQGVECKFCAETVLGVVSSLPGVFNARYHTTDDTYKESHVSFVFNQESDALPKDQLKAGLTKEGFSLVSIAPLQQNFN